jgi:hypothetical protein
MYKVVYLVSGLTSFTNEFATKEAAVASVSGGKLTPDTCIYIYDSDQKVVQFVATKEFMETLDLIEQKMIEMDPTIPPLRLGKNESAPIVLETIGQFDGLPESVAKSMKNFAKGATAQSGSLYPEEENYMKVAAPKKVDKKNMN